MTALFKRRLVFGPEVELPEPTISELFHENTKLQPDAAVGGAIPGVYSYAESRAMTMLGRCYARAQQVELTPITGLPCAAMTLEAAIVGRRTRREFSAEGISADVLSKLLFLTAGVTGEQRTADGLWRQLRAAPSGGALYPIEVYVAVRSVEGVDAGVYHYAPRDHVLERVIEGDPTPALLGACQYKESLTQASLVFIFTGVLERTKRKYGERGYRLALLEAGHVAQNLGLASTALGLGCLNVGGFFDDPLNRTLQIDGIEEAVLYVAYVGTL
jgi:SagB-type dehydrogenase family enzyme